MSNLHLGEYVARERYNDYVREAVADRLAKAATAGKPGERHNLRASLNQFMMSLKYRFHVLTHARAE